MTDLWNDRDRPVLEVVATHIASHNARIDVNAVAEVTGLTTEQVQAAGKNLERDGLVRTSGSWQAPVMFFHDVSGEALRLAKIWPTPATALDRMIAALDEIAANTDDPEEKTRAEKTRAGLGEGTKAVGYSLAAALAKHLTGL